MSGPTEATALEDIEAPEDLQSLPMVGEMNARKLALVGVTTRQELVRSDPGELGRRLAENPQAGDLTGRIELLQGFAKAQLAGDPIVLGVDPLLLDPPRPVWFFDLEFDSEHDEVFLFGWKPWQGKVEQLVGRTAKERKRIFLEFLEACERENPLLVTYGSRHADEVLMRRAADKFRVPRERVDALEYLDLQDRIVFTGSAESQLVYLPVNGFKLEVVAKALGRESTGAGNITSGYQIVKMYRRMKRTNDRKIRDRLMKYNAEDLLLLQAVFEGLRTIFRNP